jgi:capsular exopolysaccharide synthesis family protein
MTLADYLRTLRRYWVMIVLVAAVCAGAAYAISTLQTKSYKATATLAVHDPAQDLPSIGGVGQTNRTPLQVAAEHAPKVTRNAVLEQVKRELNSPLGLNGLKDLVDIEVDPNSFVVSITAEDPDPEGAAAIANAFADADEKLTTTQVRQGFKEQAQELTKEYIQRGQVKDPTSRAIYVNRLSNLQGLSVTATPVQVNEQAQKPDSPVSPKPIRNAIAGGVIGLLLGIALAYIRQFLDRRLRDSDDVEEAVGHQPIMGRVRTEALGHTGSGADASASLGPLDPLDEEAFRKLRENVRYLAVGDDLRTLAVTSAVAEEGKSTVAACLAVANAAANKRTLLVECDLRRPVFSERFGIAEKPGLTDFLVGAAQPQEILQQISVPSTGVDNGPGITPLVCITAGSPVPRPADMLSAPLFHDFIAQVSDAYDCVIVDCPPLLPVADALEVVPLVSAVILCVRLNRTTRDQARSAAEALGQLPPRPLGVVLTDDESPEESYAGYYDYRRYRDVDGPAVASEPGPGSSAENSRAGERTAPATQDIASSSPGRT